MAVTTLIDLAVGDEIKIKRNLAHPANMARGPFDEYEGTFPWILDPAMAAQQDLGRGVITERRRKPAWGEQQLLVRLRRWAAERIRRHVHRADLRNHHRRRRPPLGASCSWRGSFFLRRPVKTLVVGQPSMHRTQMEPGSSSLLLPGSPWIQKISVA